MATLGIHSVSSEVAPARLAWNFIRHFFEMCLAMCVGFAVGDLIYFAAARAAGYSSPFAELPVLSLAVVAFSMTVPMAAWMRFRGMSWRLTNEMSAAMVVEAVLLLGAGVLGLVAMADLATLEHGLMMPFMLLPMLFRLDHYTGRSGDMPHMKH